MLLTIQINGQTKTLLEYFSEVLLIELPENDEGWVNENLQRAQGSINYMVRGKITDQASFDILETNAQTHIFNAICRLANYWIVNKIFSEGESNSATTGALSYSQSNSRAPDFAPQDVRDQLELSGLYVQQHLVTGGNDSDKTLLELACGDVGKFDITYGEYLSATQDWCLATFEPKGGEGGGSTTSHITRTIAGEGPGATQEAINIDKEQRITGHTTAIAGLVAKTADINIPQANYLNIGRTGHSLIQLNQANQAPFIHLYTGLSTQLEVDESGVHFRHLPGIKANEVIPDLTEDRQFVTKKHMDEDVQVIIDELVHYNEGTTNTTIGEVGKIRMRFYYNSNRLVFWAGVASQMEINESGVEFRQIPKLKASVDIPDLTDNKQFVLKKHLDDVDDKFNPIDTKIERFEQQLSNIDADGNVAEYTADIVTANRKKFASVEHLIGVTNTMTSNSTRLNHVEAKTSNLDTNGRVINQPTQANDIVTKAYADAHGGGGGGAVYTEDLLGSDADEGPGKNQKDFNVRFNRMLSKIDQTDTQTVIGAFGDAGITLDYNLDYITFTAGLYGGLDVRNSGTHFYQIPQLKNSKDIPVLTEDRQFVTKKHLDDATAGGGGGTTDKYVNWVEGTLPVYHETLTLLDLKNLLDTANVDKITYYSDAQVSGGARTEMFKAFGILDYKATYTQLGTAFRDGDWTGPNAIQDGDYSNSTKGVDIGIGFTSFQQDTTTQTLTDDDWRSKPNGAQGDFQGTRFFSPKSTLEASQNSSWIFGQAQSDYGNRSLSVAFHLDNDFTTGTPLPDLLVKLKAWIVDTSSNTAVDTVELATVHDGPVTNVVPQTGAKERNTIYINDYSTRRFDTKIRIANDYNVANRALVYFYTINFKNDNNGSPYKLKSVRTFISRVNRAYKTDELDLYGANAKITIARAHADNSGASYSINLSSRKRIGYFEVPFGSMIQASALRTGIGRGLLFPVENNLWYITPLANKDTRAPILLEASSDINIMGMDAVNSLWQDMHFNAIVRNRAKGYDNAFVLDTSDYSFTLPYDEHKKGVKKLCLISFSGPGFLHQNQQRFRIVDSSVPDRSSLETGTALGSWTSSTATTSSSSYKSNGYSLFFFAELETGRAYKPQFFTASFGSGKPAPSADYKFYMSIEEKI